MTVVDDFSDNGGGIFDSYNGPATFLSGRSTLTMYGGSLSDDSTIHCATTTCGTTDFTEFVKHVGSKLGVPSTSFCLSSAKCGPFTTDEDGTGGGLFAGFFSSAQLNYVTISGDSSTGSGGGVAVRADDAVTIDDSLLTGNSAETVGGAIFNTDNGDVTLSYSTVVDNTTTGTGGGIFNQYYCETYVTEEFPYECRTSEPFPSDSVHSTVSMTGGTLSGNTAKYFGGGLDNTGSATLTGVTVADNSSPVTGGGIANWDALTGKDLSVVGNHTGTAGAGLFTFGGYYGTHETGAEMDLTSSTVSGNVVATGTTTGDGGGVFVAEAGATLTNDTIEGNTVHDGDGAGVFAYGDVSITETTIADNVVTVPPTGTTAPSNAGAGLSDGTLVELTASIVAGNTLAGAEDDCGFFSTATAISSGGYNVAGDLSCGLTGIGDQQNATPKLGPLGYYGGSTETMPLEPASPAVNAKSGSNCATKTDERGYPRPSTIQGVAGCDAGAYQLQPEGYWTVASDGGVFNYGTAGFYGSMGGEPLAAPIVGMASTPSGDGYWLVGSDGGVFAFGDAPFLGSLPLTHVTETTIVGIASTPTGGGYWLVGADGAVYAFGDAPYLGGMFGTTLAAPVVGISADGYNGYWLVGADGGVYSFGSSAFYGSLALTSESHPIVGMETSHDGLGYTLAGADGGAYAFGDAVFYGSMVGLHLDAPMDGITSTTDGLGYWMVGKDGGVFSFGDAYFLGSMGGKPLNAPMVGIAATLSS